MTEITPLLKQKSDVPCYDAASKTEDDLAGNQEEPFTSEAEVEIPVLDIVKALYSEWLQNGANLELTPLEIMAMHVQYRQVTGGREVFHSQHVIMNELADAMLRWTQQKYNYFCYPFALGLRHDILRNLRENWQSIIQFDEDLARSLNTYHPPTYQERIQNAWTNCVRMYAALKSYLSHFICQLLLIIILLGWLLSLLIMGTEYISQCPMNSFLPTAMAAIGLTGIIALLLRLVLISIERWYWLPVRTLILWLSIVLKVLEFAFLLALILYSWVFLAHFSPSFDSKDPNFCNETFYTFMCWMKPVSTAFAAVWLFACFVKTIVFVMRIRYHYRPLFELV